MSLVTMGRKAFAGESAFSIPFSLLASHLHEIVLTISHSFTFVGP